MTLRIPSAGEAKLLEFMLGKSAAETLQLRLFSNNVTPGESDVLATYTQVTGGGYAAQTLTGASWVISAGDPSVAVYPQVTFSFTGAVGNVYGYFIVSTTSNTVVWAERFTDGPYNVSQSGDSIRVTPRITLSDTLD